MLVTRQRVTLFNTITRVGRLLVARQSLWQFDLIWSASSKIVVICACSNALVDVFQRTSCQPNHVWKTSSDRRLNKGSCVLQALMITQETGMHWTAWQRPRGLQRLPHQVPLQAQAALEAPQGP